MNSFDKSLKYPSYVSREMLMESALYRSIFEEGEADGIAKATARMYASTILRVLMYRLGSVDRAVRTQIQTTTEADQLNVWYEEALMAADTDTVRRLADKIRNAGQQPST